MIRQRAQALIEFAAVFPIFILLVLGLLDLGRGVWHYNTAAYVARDAARQLELQVDPNSSQFLDRCRAMFPLESCSRTPPASSTKVLVEPTACPTPEVKVTYTFQPIVTGLFKLVDPEANDWAAFDITATSLAPVVPGVCS